jgi:hypothetical protein
MYMGEDPLKTNGLNVVPGTNPNERIGNQNSHYAKRMSQQLPFSGRPKHSQSLIAAGASSSLGAAEHACNFLAR